MQTTITNAAREFAVEAHGDQKYGDLPYVCHLDMVAGIAREYGEQAQMLAYLHDVVEDTSVGLDRIAAEFGSYVAECVRLLTDEPGANRRERKARTNEKLSKVRAPYNIALVVKAADRLANLRMSVQEQNSEKLAMYLREHEAFCEAAYRIDLCEPLWVEMDQILGT